MLRWMNHTTWWDQGMDFFRRRRQMWEDSNIYQSQNILNNKSLKISVWSFQRVWKNCSCAFTSPSLWLVRFEEGTELDFVGKHVFGYNAKSLKLPLINGDLEEDSLDFGGVIEFPPNLYLRNKELNIKAEKIICPLSSLPAVACFNFLGKNPKLVFRNK